jgi:hypothetical protein
VARCRCDPDSCACHIIAGVGINVAGTGDANAPWIVSTIPICIDCAAPANPGDVPTWDATLGKYVPQAPAETPESCVDCAAAGNPGDVLTWASGTYVPAPVPTGPQGEPGADGPAGPQGPPGESVQIMGSVPTSADLDSVTTPAVGDGWIAEDTGSLWVYTGPDPNDDISKWTEVGSIVGPPGPTGERGSLWYNGSGAPTGIVSELPNDHYLDVVSGDVYEFV